MSPERWAKLEAWFALALEQPAERREAWVRARCRDEGESESFAAELLAMLAEDEKREGPLEASWESALAPFRMPNAPPAAFGPYRVLRLLGEGGMGVVWLAEREDISHRAAIKVLRDSWLSPARRQRFIDEQRLLAKLEHPLIARFLESGATPDASLYYVMEYVEGRPLDSYLREEAPDLKARLRLFEQVTEAVQYLHRQAVLHRDIKPSNILVEASGRPRLLDFGIAKPLSETGQATRTQGGLMTPAYASPEQLAGEPLGVESDVYSLGVVMAESLPPGLPGYSRDVAALVATACAKDRGQRYPSAEALLRDLRHWAANEPLEARPAHWTYRARKFIVRQRRAVALAAGVTLVVASLGAALWWEQRKEMAASERALRVKEFLLLLLEGGEEEAGPAGELRVRTLVERGVKEAQTLASEPAVLGELKNTLGRVLLKLGDVERAETLLEEALALRGPGAEIYQDLALLRASQANYEEAERWARQSIRVAARKEQARAHAVWGQVLEDQGKYKEALAALARVDAYAPSDKVQAAAWTERGNCHFYLGQYEEARRWYEQARAADQRIFGPQHPHVADDLVNLGAIDSETGELAGALDKYSRALGIKQAWYGEEHAGVAGILTMRARALLRQPGNAPAAAEDLKKALAIQEKVWGAAHPKVASALNELGTLAGQERRYSDSEAYYRRAAEIYRAVYPQGHFTLGVALSNLAGASLKQGQAARAMEYIEQAIGVFEQSLPAGHSSTALARIRQGQIALALGDKGKAQSVTRQALAELGEAPGLEAWREIAQTTLQRAKAL
ncbi:MAG: hypothetical protein OHK0021_17200 [Bryobacter sp.]